MKAKARFKNNNASVDLESETFIKNYRIKFNVRGTLSHLKPEFQSNPPLPPRDILTLLSLGELFERPTTTELSSQIGTGTTGLIAQEITEQIKKRTKKIFGDYVLRINPNITNIAGASVEGSSRVIVGKSIARDVLIVYSTNFSTQRQEVVYVQYQLSPTVSLIGKRNENGRFSIDIRFRRRH
jgi:autotransporter translocation and assembly factor TamB